MSEESHPTPTWPQLQSIAGQLYGGRIDLWTVTREPEGEAEPGDVRDLLRRQCDLVQDPITGLWFSPLHSKQGEPPTPATAPSP